MIDVIWQCSRCKMPLSEVLRAQSRLQVERPDMDRKRTENGRRIGRTSEMSKKRKNRNGTVEQCAAACRIWPVRTQWCGHLFFPTKLDWAAEILVYSLRIQLHSAYFSLLRCMRTWRCADWKEDRMTIILTSTCLGIFGVRWEDVALSQRQNAHSTPVDVDWTCMPNYMFFQDAVHIDFFAWETGRFVHNLTSMSLVERCWTSVLWLSSKTWLQCIPARLHSPLDRCKWSSWIEESLPSGKLAFWLLQNHSQHYVHTSSFSACFGRKAGGRFLLCSIKSDVLFSRCRSDSFYKESAFILSASSWWRLRRFSWLGTQVDFTRLHIKTVFVSCNMS